MKEFSKKHLTSFFFIVISLTISIQMGMICFYLSQISKYTRLSWVYQHSSTCEYIRIEEMEKDRKNKEKNGGNK